MKKVNQQGSLLVPFITVFLLLFVAAGFGIWSYMTAQDYKNNVNQKVGAAVAVAKKETASAKDNEFAAKEKEPLKSYNGPAAYGSITLQYPKTWSAYVIEGKSTPIDGYLQPGFVPDVSSAAAFALRVQVTSTSYDQELVQFDSSVKTGSLKATPYQLPKVSSVTGIKLDGAISSTKNGSEVLIPLRDKTLKVWTESNDYLNDFNNNILPNLTFIP